jgi:hypothetical protein
MLGEDVGAAVVLREGVMATEQELGAFLSEQLAAYKTPRRGRAPTVARRTPGYAGESRLARRATGVGAGIQLSGWTARLQTLDDLALDDLALDDLALARRSHAVHVELVLRAAIWQGDLVAPPFDLACH